MVKNKLKKFTIIKAKVLKAADAGRFTKDVKSLGKRNRQDLRQQRSNNTGVGDDQQVLP